MRLFRRLCLWLTENRFLHKARRLQRAQLEEHHQIVDQVRRGRMDTLHDLADAVLRLQAVSDRLEESIQEMGEDRG